MSSTPSVNPQEPGSGPSGAPPKKSNALLWILGIFGGLALIVVLAVFGLGFFVMHKVKQAGFDPELAKKNPGLASAKVMVATNPDLEIVSSDDKAGTVVIHNKKDGKTVTMKFDAAKRSMVILDENGKQSVSVSGEGEISSIEVNGAEGSTKIGTNADKGPSWLPVYPGSSPQSTFSADAKEARSGAYSFVTQEEAQKVLNFYAESLKSAGITTSTTTSNSDGKVSGLVVGEDKDKIRSANVVASTEGDGTHVAVSYSEKKTP
jgi:hypothetical protein